MVKGSTRRSELTIVFTSARDGNLEIYVMDADGGNQENLTNNPANDSQPDWSPDGTKIAFVSGPRPYTNLRNGCRWKEPDWIDRWKGR